MQSIPFVIRLAIIVSAISLLGWIISCLNISVLRIKGYYYYRLKQKFLPVLENIILKKVVIHPQLNTTPVEDIQLPLEELVQLGILKNRYKRKIFTTYLKELRETLAGKVNLLLRKLYLDLHLNEYAAKKLASWNTSKAILALNELVFFEAPDDNRQTDQLIHSKNKHIREKVLSYIFKVYKTDTFDSFSRIKEPFSKWEHINYFDIISNRRDIGMPEFGQWISPQYHRSVILLCLDLIVHYLQFEAIPAITKMLAENNIDTELKCKLINSLGKLYQKEPVPALLKLYPGETNIHVKHEILKALGRMGDDESLPFLKEAFKNEESLFLKKHAVRSILELGNSEPAIEALLQESTEERTRSTIKHVMNPLLKY